jgi:hypothetical protein
MARRKQDISTDITKVNPQLPDFMQGEKVLGTESLTEYVVPPRIKVVQKQASEQLLDVFAPGDVILTPTQSVVVQLERDAKGRPVEDQDASFFVVPLFFYPEWATWNPIALKGQEPAIRYRTLDPTDPIVHKSRNKDLRYDNHPDRADLKVRHVEHLNFVVMLIDHPLAGTPVVVSFSRGEHWVGNNFASLIKMRNAPLFGCVFTLTPKFRPGQLGDWWGLDVANPESRSPWVDDKDIYEKCKALHLEFAEYHKSSRLRTNLDDDGVTEDAMATNEM